MDTTKTIILIAEQDVWQRALETGEYIQSTLDTMLADVGFIHCSFPNQTLEILNGRFKDRGNLILLFVDVSKVKPLIKYEGAKSGRPGTFPHIYGPLNVDAAYAQFPLAKNEHGEFIAPAELGKLELQSF